jgi:hypothetical protein
MYSGLSRGARRAGSLERESKETEVRMAALKEQLLRNEKRGQFRQLLINYAVKAGMRVGGNLEKYEAIQEGAKQIGATPIEGSRGAFLSSLMGPDMGSKYSVNGRTLSAYDMLLLGNTSRYSTNQGKKLGQWMVGPGTYDLESVKSAVDKPSGDMTTPVTNDDIF